MKNLSCLLAASALVLASGLGSGTFFLNAVSSAQAQEKGHGSRQSHPHHHFNAHDLLGENLHHDGKHDIGKIGSRTVTAEVKGSKVVGMTAGGLTMTKVKSGRKMAMANPMSGITAVAYTNDDQLAQYDTSSEYYGYCTDDGYETTCYWYVASDVDTGGFWEDYTTYDTSYY